MKSLGFPSSAPPYPPYLRDSLRKLLTDGAVRSRMHRYDLYD